MSKADLRVAIAKDVIAQVKAGRLRPKVGGFLKGIPTNAKDEDDLRDVLKGQTCEVCAVGGLFVAALDRKNSITVDEVVHHADRYWNDGPARATGFGTIEYVKRWFADWQVALVEMAYE